MEARSWCVNSPIARVRLEADNERLESEVAMLREELRIKNARLSRIAPANRPHYPPTERLAILALKAARGWNNAQTGRAFLLTDVTIATWLRRIDESGSDALVKLPEPINRFPDFVRQVVQQLKCVCPTMGKVRIAQMPVRAGLQLSPTTVRRFLRQPMGSKLPPSDTARGVAERSGALKAKTIASKSVRTIVAKYPHHVWHLDFTIVSTHFGFWVPWFPFACVQRWPIAYCVAVLVDHFSRKAFASAVFKNWPSSQDTTDWLDVIIQSIGRGPTYIVTDQGPQFGEDYEDWCSARGRYNHARPHQSLGGRTPNEVNLGIPSAREGPKFEARPRMMKSMGRRNRRHEAVATSDLALVVDYLEHRQHLPLVSLKRAA